MTSHPFTRTALAAIATLVALCAAPAQAQNMAAQNAAFDQRMAAMVNNAQMQLQQSQQQLWQYHLRENGPRLRQQYAQMVASGTAVGSFEQFAYWDLMSAGGTDPQGALRQQQAQFRGQQQAHQTAMEGHAIHNESWAANSQRRSAAAENFSQQAIRGVGPYVDPASGRTTMLPHSLPAGTVYQSGGNTYAQDAGGSYWRLDNNAWVRLNAAR